MCGIVGVSNDSNAYKIIIEGLENLEYRGYDSAGFFLAPNKIYKTTSRVASLKSKNKDIVSNCGMGHTRWATTGKVSIKNAHPHQSYHKKFVLVHNGIISNYLEYKYKLIKEGYVFKSDTDSEVIVNYLEYLYSQNSDMDYCLKKLIEDLKGEMALIISMKGDEGLYFVKKGSPLVVGKKDSSFYLASDVLAISNYSDSFYFPNDGEYGYVSKSNSYVINKNEQNSITFNQEQFENNTTTSTGFSCFLLKEIYDQVNLIDAISKTYTSGNKLSLYYQDIKKSLKSSKHINLIGCGSSFNAASYIKSLDHSSHISTYVGSEYVKINKDETYILISQSGETYDLIQLAKKIKKKKAKMIVLTNTPHSTLARMSDITLNMCAGYEKSVAATKSFLASITILTLLTKDISNVTNYLNKVKRSIKYTLKHEDKFNDLAKKISKLTSLYYIGKDIDYAICQEGGLKLKEISYLHVEAMLSGELKHGPIATVNKKFGALGISTKSSSDEKIKTALAEVKCRKAPVFFLSLSKDISEIRFLKGPKYLTGVGIIIGLQILSYKVANILKRDIDKPRNLAKSVTVI
ncbi:MAG TPA: glutamine--fructose-6-phosphate transaminase (isomerizing) [Firmicutes bacterium]|nr:glutamine--fructose-6-phosphate transaminase (isomerizing) [Bacillota bacterium]